MGYNSKLSLSLCILMNFLIGLIFKPEAGARVSDVVVVKDCAMQAYFNSAECDGLDGQNFNCCQTVVGILHAICEGNFDDAGRGMHVLNVEC
ncbi:MAG: hypothetical protein DCC75_11350 [Proteobacteria bacterium]|nr:MAG: hypothetical protein DCC75_11350 [Pseudomonadota bacterium]